MNTSNKINSNTTKNLCGKIRNINNPYEIWVEGDWEWRVLKKYKTPEQEAKDPSARWFCAVQSPFTYGSFDYGDTYVQEIIKTAKKVEDMEVYRAIRGEL